jgi:hypothetical protein
VNDAVFVLPGQGWKHTIRHSDHETYTEDLVGWLITIEGRHARANPIVRSGEQGEVWNQNAGEIDLPEHVAAALGVEEVENITYTRPTSRWPE